MVAEIDTVIHKYCEFFETQEGILFKTRKILKYEDKLHSVPIKCYFVM